jgi:hypothetical protein
MDDTIDYLASHNVRLLKKGEVRDTNSTNVGATVGMLWLDVEGTQYWSSSPSNNVNFLQGMVDEGNARGVSIGKILFCTMLGKYNSKTYPNV